MTEAREILLVEDDPADARLTREALKACAAESVLRHVEDGIEALDYLHHRGRYAASARPDLIVLDLNLPRKDGREVLAEIKTHESLRLIPVIVFTTSNAEHDVLRSYRLNANGYVSKPAELHAYMDAVRMMQQFWANTARLPEQV